MNLIAREAKKFNKVTPSSSVNFLSFTGEVLQTVLSWGFYFGLTPTDINPVESPESIGFVRSGWWFMCGNRRTKPTRWRRNGRALVAGGKYQLKSAKSKRITPALIADARDGSGELKEPLNAKGQIDGLSIGRPMPFTQDSPRN